MAEWQLFASIHFLDFGASVALDIAAPMELTVASLLDLHLMRVVPAAATHESASIGAS